MSYDYSERFNNWQSGGATATATAEQVIDPAQTETDTITDNLRAFVCSAEDNSEILTTDLYYSLNAFDWNFIWSHIQKPQWWDTSDSEFHIDYLLCEWWEILDEAIRGGNSDDDDNIFETLDMDPMLAPDSYGFFACIDTAEVKALYRKLAMEIHPDQGGDADAFAALADAYKQSLSYYA